MNILILGGTGFLGKALAVALARKHYPVRVYSPSASSPLNNFQQLGIGGFDGRIEDLKLVSSHILWADAIFHFASSSNPNAISPSLEDDLISNVSPLLWILELIRGTKKRFVFCSSGGAVYGNTPNTIKSEIDLAAPINSYGLIKKVMEDYVLFYHRNFELRSLILRPGNIYGAKFATIGKQGIISTLIKNASFGRATQIWAPLKIQKDYLFIDDFVAAVISLLEIGATGIFNLGSGSGTSLENIFILVERALGRSVPLQLMESNSQDAGFILKIDKLTSQIDWRPKISMEQGIKRVWSELMIMKGEAHYE